MTLLLFFVGLFCFLFDPFRFIEVFLHPLFLQVVNIVILENIVFSVYFFQASQKPLGVNPRNRRYYEEDEVEEEGELDDQLVYEVFLPRKMWSGFD